MQMSKVPIISGYGERHFEKDQFAVNPDVAATVGFQPKSKMLITGAVPTIFDYTDPKTRLSQHGNRPAENPPLTPCILSSVKICEHLKPVTILECTVT